MWGKTKLYNKREEGNAYGEYLDQQRKKWGVTLDQLCRGVCTVSMLVSILNGEKTPGKLLRERLQERVGISNDEYKTYLDCDEYNEWKMQQEILVLLEKQNEELKEKLKLYAQTYIVHKEDKEVAEITKNIFEETAAYKENIKTEEKKKNNANQKLRFQFYLYIKAMYKKQQKAPVKEQINLFEKAVKQTVPDIDKESVIYLLLSPQELDLILEYERCRPRCEAVVKYREVLKYLENSKIEENSKVKNYPKTVLYLCQALLAEKEITAYTYAEVLRLCDSAINLLRTTRRSYYLWEILCLKKQVLTQIKMQNCNHGESAKEEILNKMLAPIEEQIKILKEIYERFGVSKERKESCYIYYGQDTYPIGDIIRIRRKMLGIKREELCDGICSLDTLRRLEKKQKSTQPYIVQQLCIRLKLSPECERTELITSDIRARKLEREIRYAVNEERFKEAKVLLEELKTRIDLSNHINAQWVVDIEGLTKYRLGLMNEEQYRNQLKQALEYTLPLSIMELSDTQECYLTNSEMSCMYHFSLLEKKKENWMEAERWMKLINRMLQNYKGQDQIRNHVRNCELYIGYKASILCGLEKYELSQMYAEKVMQLCLGMGRINMVSKVLYDWVQSTWMIKQTEDKRQDDSWKSDLEYCLALSRFCKNVTLENFYKDVLQKVSDFLAGREKEEKDFQNFHNRKN